MQTQLLETIEKMRQAMINADKDLLSFVTDTNLTYGHSSGLIENKEQFIARIGGASVFKELVLTEHSVVIDENIACARHIMEAKTLEDGIPSQAHIGVLQTWILKDYQWLLFSRQAFKI